MGIIYVKKIGEIHVKESKGDILELIKSTHNDFIKVTRTKTYNSTDPEYNMTNNNTYSVNDIDIRKKNIITIE